MLQPLDLNLGTRPFRNNTMLWTGVSLGLFLLIWLSWWNYTTWKSESEALVSLREDVSSIDSQLMELEIREEISRNGVKAYDLDQLATQTVRANDVIMLKAFSWTRLFNRLEKIQPYEVRMQAVRPVFRLGKKRSRREVDLGWHMEEQSVVVTVDGIAKNLRAFLAFETALMDDPWFDRVEPERWDDLDTGETQFSMKFQYYPNKSPEEPASETEVEEGADGGESGAGAVD